MNFAYELRRATLEDAALIAEHARKADVDELWAAGQRTPFECMILGMSLSLEVFTGFIGGEPVCMFGVACVSLVTGEGLPWMVGTDAIDRHALEFIRGSREIISDMLSQWQHLWNWVDARNTRAVRWLKYLGFTVHPAAPYGTFGLPFHYFEMRRDHV